jgi:hypothetical protein
VAESVEDDLNKMTGVRTGDVSGRTENSRGQFWKKLRCTKDCNARRRRRGGGRRRFSSKIHTKLTGFEYLTVSSMKFTVF